MSIEQTEIWHKLANHAKAIKTPVNHLKELLKDPQRISTFSLNANGLWFDFSRQRITSETLALLYQLACEQNVQEHFAAMTQGAIVNTTEDRAALHTACRKFDNKTVRVDGMDVVPDILAARKSAALFCEKVHSGEIKGSTGKQFTHAVVVGIGGSYLGTQFVAQALYAHADRGIQLHYLSNVDSHNFNAICDQIDPETTLWIVISKSYKTAETLANTRLATRFMRDEGIDPSKHIVTVTAKGSPGDDPTNPVLASFHMFDFIGGRYSVSSAVGAVPLGLYLGPDRFEDFLKGMAAMDQHALTAPPHLNGPLTAALIAIWNNNFMGYSAQALIPYASFLDKLAPHFQQLNMESCGKSVTLQNNPAPTPTGTIIFGEPGTNAQHSFFQLAHQGRPFPIDFIGVLKPNYPQIKDPKANVTNHEELWANLMAQAAALAVGQSSTDPMRRFDGNRPSSTLVIKSLSPEDIGRLLAFYEHRTVYEAFLWDINPFDQFGVELGKTMAADIRQKIIRTQTDPTGDQQKDDLIESCYLNMLKSGQLPPNQNWEK